MKKAIIENAKITDVKDDHRTETQELVVFGDDNMTVSDGYHTMDELYDHRIELFIALCRIYGRAELFRVHDQADLAWRSKFHADGTMFEGWFVMGLGKKNSRQITYHLPIDRWKETNFADTLDKAPEFDGHTSEDVLKRLKEL